MGLWTLAYYGSGYSAKDFQALPVLDYVREHTRVPYICLGETFTAAAITMATALQSPVLTNFIRRNARTLGNATTLGMIGIMVLEYRLALFFKVFHHHPLSHIFIFFPV